MIDSIESTVDDLRATIGAVPRPIEVLLGFPALAWGVYTRARRRQGWWVSAFGAAGLAVVSVSLLGNERSTPEIGLSLLYSAVLGLLVGYLVIRADKFLTGTRGRRARALEEAAAHRPEPGRMRPLL
jgi:peptidoglycan/LPS O-acetylase OafA/YrhL